MLGELYLFEQCIPLYPDGKHNFFLFGGNQRQTEIGQTERSILDQRLNQLL
jgi:hypothetical protein